MGWPRVHSFITRYGASVLSKGLCSARDEKMNGTSLCHHFQVKTRPYVHEKQCSNGTKYAQFGLILENWSSVTLRALYNLLPCTLLLWEEADTVCRSTSNGFCNFVLNSLTSVGLYFLLLKLRGWINSTMLRFLLVLNFYNVVMFASIKERKKISLIHSGDLLSATYVPGTGLDHAYTN